MRRAKKKRKEKKGKSKKKKKQKEKERGEVVDKLRQMIVPLHVGETLPLNEPVSGHGNCD